MMTVQGIREAILPTAPNEAGVSEGCVLIAAGVNKTGRRRYTAEFLQAHVGRFEGAFCNADHPAISEARERPERSTRDLAAVVRNARWDPETSSVLGDVEYLGTAAGRDMREAFSHEVVRSRAGLSIYWPGGVKVKREKLREGGTVDVPMELLGEGLFDVDFVTRPSAGGRVAPLREGEGNESMLTDVTREQLEAERPDLIEAIRDGYVRKADVTPPPDHSDALAEAGRRIEALEKRNRQLEAGEVVRAALAESGLPEPARALVAGRFAEAEMTEGFAESVAAEIDAVRALAQSLSEAGRVRGISPEPQTAGTDFNAMAGVRRAFGIPEPNQG